MMVDLQQLKIQFLQDQERAQAFGITLENVNQTLEQRLQIFPAIYPAILHLCQDDLKLNLNVSAMLWDTWLPLALKLADHRRAANRLLVQGILGGQGTGKTTLGRVLTLILQHLGYRSLSLSLDDLYKTYEDRQALRDRDPRLIWRGPPGTHDISLGLTILERLRDAHPLAEIAVPRFDKSLHGGQGDRTVPELVQGIDILLFEGWFVGVQPIDPAAFLHPPFPIVTEADRTFARDMNTSLQDYLPLWDQLDLLMVLFPVDYRLSLAWRQQAEHQLIARGKSGMTDREIEQFVTYFWKSLHPELFLPPLIQSPDRANLVIEINPDHSWGRIYRPGNP
ncbi:glycerate kinase [Leptolyngbya sp. 'hensonii']|uniref:glycerate kinase n=1 Tax=Leptolyngbya sp. 'hensonii' TaxID=1922337 RepID=UPI00095034B4|nr:glycerate kinase [Leptolyngbya sp. 'hensonii']OLP16532.1 glycerate kinase [Leptolyngbya sp. 'hensonii']